MRTVHRLTLASTTALAVALAAAPAAAAEAQVDRSQKYQLIDGFGFFGAHNVWWGSAASVVDDAWVSMVIDDLGLSIWRNEYYPPSDAMDTQDADWAKQQPVAEAFRQQAAESGVPLKTILTVWSPPASMKCLYDDAGVHEDTPHPDGTKGGGALCPSRRADFAQWLIEGIDLYAAIGMDVYALSFQNEPYFWQSYNSCFYAQDVYADTLAEIGPIVRAAYPDVRLFGSENMLEIECGRNGDEFDPWWYTATIMDNSAALTELDIWAVHGYSDGVTATESSRMSTLWANFLGGVTSTSRPIWMTETSGYVDSWEKGPNSSGDETQGAMDLAQAMFAGLRYGNLSAWVWWQGSELDGSAPSEYALMRGTEFQGKRYYVSKNFYRYIRPGAQRVEVTSDDTDVLLVAFEHTGLGSFTLVAINAAHEDKPLSITGADLPATLEVHRSSATEDCADLGPVDLLSITLPSRSVTTFTAGSYQDDVPAQGTGGAPGAGGAPAAGGASGTAGTSAMGGASGTPDTGGAAGTPAAGGAAGAPAAGGAAGSGLPSGTGGSPGVGGTQVDPGTGGTAGATVSPGSGGAAGESVGLASGGSAGESSVPGSGGSAGDPSPAASGGVEGSTPVGGSPGVASDTGGQPNVAATAGAGGLDDSAAASADEGGCGCRVVSPHRSWRTSAALSALLLLVAARRRRRRRAM